MSDKATAAAAKQNQTLITFGILGAFSFVCVIVNFSSASSEEPSGAVAQVTRVVSKYGLAAFMVMGASMRLDVKKVKKILLPIMPPFIPVVFHKPAIYIAGFVELVAGIYMALIDEALGAWVIFILLIGVYPANIYHAISPTAQKTTGIGPPAVYVRAVLQLVFLAWAYSHTLPLR
eukprot:m.118366 g.118366  ORF g.118366 m.118366 type:complete len:176 (+) comp28657_c0_seq1:212-739(+)